MRHLYVEVARTRRLGFPVCVTLHIPERRRIHTSPHRLAWRWHEAKASSIPMTGCLLCLPSVCINWTLLRHKIAASADHCVLKVSRQFRLTDS